MNRAREALTRAVNKAIERGDPVYVNRPKTYRLGSSEMVHAPGVVRWAVNGYAFTKDRPYLRRVFIDGWGLPSAAADALLSGKVPYTVEGETVVFENPEETAR